MRCRIDANATASGATCYENRLNRLPSSRALCWRIDPAAAMLTSAHREATAGALGGHPLQGGVNGADGGGGTAMSPWPRF
jgi:hypothetical protein